MALGLESGFAFSLAGPLNSESWQVGEIGYQLPGDLVTPKNLGEEYRRNVPVLYYYIDQNFRDYFGSNGVLAIEQAFNMFNSLTNVDQYSLELSEFPLQTQRENYRAEALNLLDLKSYCMGLICEQLGMAAPERYVWGLHDRLHFADPPPCPGNMDYTIIQRNFDPVPSPLSQFQSSSYVNGTLYSYSIAEFCVPPNPVAITVPFQVDPLDSGFTSIAGSLDGIFVPTTGILGGLVNGRFWTGLTRDDVGCLRYLLRTNNVNFEAGGTNTLSYITNNSPQLLVTSNLTLLAEQALTNNAATLAGLFPGLAILSSTPIFTNIYTTNVTPYFTNSPYDPVGSPARLAFVTNVTANVLTYFKHTFGNLFTLKYTPQGWNLSPLYTIPPPVSGVTVSLLTTSVGFTNSPFFPVGTTNTILTTNTVITTFRTNDYDGDFVLLPTNLCSVQILFSQLTNVISFTNQIASATNASAVTNGGLVSFTEDLITYFTNHVFVINPVSCNTNALAWRQGIQKVSFVRIPDNGLDEFSYNFYNPVTNNYTVITYDPTNNVYVPQRNQRLVITPDIVITAADLADIPGNQTIGTADAARFINWDSSTNYGLAYQNLAGPGTIIPAGLPQLTAFAFNKVGPIYGNASPNAFTLEAEAAQFPLLIWGSFDGTTNLPVVYPNGTTVTNIENLVLFHVLPLSLPNGILNNAYPTTTFSATGGRAPYTWTLAPGSSGFPPGITMSTDGTISGAATQGGTFDFVIRMTDATGRVVDYTYSITINL